MLPKRATFALAITAIALALLLNFKTPETTTPTALLAANETTPTSSSTAATGTTTGSTTGGATTGTTTGTTSTSGGLKAGTYTGNAVSFRYGTVQVQATVANGKITNVSILQYPSNDPRSSQISQNALPRLVSETLQAQSAQISSVSGATFTSQGYMSSLQSALDQANA
jgi:uncharacterized protein with FMN-binding domain